VRSRFIWLTITSVCGFSEEEEEEEDDDEYSGCLKDSFLTQRSDCPFLKV
jgi:hypothetical protein